MGDLPMMETWPQLYVDDADERFALSALARAAAPRGSHMDLCRVRRRTGTAIYALLAVAVAESARINRS